MFELGKTCVFVLALSLASFALFDLTARVKFYEARSPMRWLIPCFAPCAAFLSPNILIFNLLCLAAVPVFARKRNQIAPLYLLFYLTIPHVSVEVSLGDLYLKAINAGASLGVGALIALAIHRAPRPSSIRFIQDVPAWVLIGLMIIIGARGSSFTNYLRVTLDILSSLAVPYFVVSRSIRSVEDARYVVAGLIAATMTLSAIVIFEAIRVWPIYRAVWAHYGIALGSGESVKVRGGMLRAPGPFTEPTSLALCLTLGAVALVTARSQFKSSVHRLAAGCLVGLGLIYPQSRGAWVGFAVAWLASNAGQRRWGAVGKAIATLAIAWMGIVAASSVSPWIADLAGRNANDAGVVDYRHQLLISGLEQVRERPLFGAPLGDVIANLSSLRQGEGIVDIVNTYLNVAMVTGLTGLAIFVGLFLTKLIGAWKLSGDVRRSQAEREVSVYIFAALVGLSAMIAFTIFGGRTSGMMVVLLAMESGVKSIAPARRRRSVPVERKLQSAVA